MVDLFIYLFIYICICIYLLRLKLWNAVSETNQGLHQAVGCIRRSLRGGSTSNSDYTRKAGTPYSWKKNIKQYNNIKLNNSCISWINKLYLKHTCVPRHVINCRIVKSWRANPRTVLPLRLCSLEELEKFKFVLDYKIRELKAEIGDADFRFVYQKGMGTFYVSVFWSEKQCWIYMDLLIYKWQF